MASLQGFQEVSLTAPVSKSVMTVTDSVVRFNVADAKAGTMKKRGRKKAADAE